MATASKSAKQPARREVSRTVHPGVYERGIGTASPYFQVRIRHRGEKHKTERFPYAPRGELGKSGEKRAGAKREAALANAIAAASREKATFHFYGKPGTQVADEFTLRQWITAWQSEACDRIDLATGASITELPERKGAAEDRKQIGRLITLADTYAKNHKRPSLMDRRIPELTRQDFQGLLKLMTGRKPKPTPEDPDPSKPPASAATKRRALALLSAVWNHAAEHWNMKVPPRPWEGIIIRSDGKKAKAGRALDQDELAKVNAALAQVHPNTLAALLFLRWTAARAGEMRKLRWENIGWIKGREMVKFEGTKTPVQGAYRERTIPLVEGALAALAMMFDPAKGPPKSGVVFPSPTNPKQPISRHTAYQAWVRAIRRAGVPHARLHDLRHTRTTELSATLEKAQAMVITGHSDERTFTRYTHLAEETAKRIAEGDARRVLQAKGKTKEDLKGPAVLEILKGLELTAEERMQAIALLAGK